MKDIKAQLKTGFTLLFAVLISSLILSVGIAILDLTLKEFLLSSAGRESQYAFYAADTGLECALFWDRNAINFSDDPVSGISSFPTSTASVNAGAGVIFCGGKTPGITLPAPTSLPSSPYDVTTEFWVGSSTDPCAKVDVTKHYDSVTGLASTTIQSRGYNTCDFNNPRVVERGLQTNQ